MEEVLVHISNVSHIKPLLKDYSVQEIFGFEIFSAVLLKTRSSGMGCCVNGQGVHARPCSRWPALSLCVIQHHAIKTCGDTEV